jgi:Rho-binding antiterminator
MQDNYIPVACSFYDQLEVLAMRRTPVEIEYVNEGETREIKGKIVDVYCAVDRVEYLKVDHGLEIRLDTISKLNGETPPNYC